MRKPGIVKRLALVLGSLVFTLLLLEVFLQLGALAVRITGREDPEGFTGGTHRVLCLGDSNTYGFYVDREEAYPQQLKALWRERGNEPPIDVMNLGFPGLNSSRLLLRYPELVEKLSPDVVIVMIGVNDFWTVPAPSADDRGWFTRAQGLLERHSRAYRLLLMIRRSLASSDAVPGADPAAEAIIDPEPRPNDRGARHRLRMGDREIDMGFRRAGPGGVEGYQEALYGNLQQLVVETARFPTEILFMTYPSRENFYGIANRIVRQVARKTETPLVDLARVFARLCPAEPCPALLYEDHHPTAAGYRVIAETLVARLTRWIPD